MADVIDGQRTLVVVRHAKAAWPDDVSDLERPLTGRGRRDAAALGAWLVDRGLVPEVVLCSTATRAAQTWAGAQMQVAKAAAERGSELLVRPEAAVYDAPASRLLSLLRALDAGESEAGAGCALMVGHNPGVEELVARLCGRSVHLKTAGIALLAVSGPWAELDSAELAELATCRAG